MNPAPTIVFVGEGFIPSLVRTGVGDNDSDKHTEGEFEDAVGFSARSFRDWLYRRTNDSGAKRTGRKKGRANPVCSELTVIQLFRMGGVFLIGFMSAGKTSVGRALAALLEWSFIDLDERLEERFGATIPEIFADDGETVFRQAEQEELVRAATESDVVVATGGGAFCSRDNRQIIASSGGTSVYLDLPWTALQSRLADESEHRPLYVDSAQAEALFDARAPVYRKAKLVIALDGTESVAEVAQRVALVVREAQCAISS